MVDWVDFVQLHGTQYVAGVDGKGPAIASNQLGAVVGRVECELSILKFHVEPGPAVNGDAAFLKVGTEVHAVRGYATSCRVAVQIAGVNRDYLAHADLAGVSRAVPCAKVPYPSSASSPGRDIIWDCGRAVTGDARGLGILNPQADRSLAGVGLSGLIGRGLPVACKARVASVPALPETVSSLPVE